MIDRTYTSKKTAAIAVLLVILIAGAALRLYLSPVTLSGDIHAFRSWTESSVKLGLVESYEHQVSGNDLPVYPPLSIMLFQAAGKLYQWTYSPDYNIVEPVHTIFVKGPAMAADLLGCIILFLLFVRWKQYWRGVIAAAIYAFHPAVLYDSTLWGQTDSIYSLFVFAALVGFVWKKNALGAGLFTLALLTKPQAVMFAPLILLIVPWNTRSILSMAGGAFATGGMVLLPFILTGKILVALQTYSLMHVMHVSRVSWNAYNFWWLFLKGSSWTTPGSVMIGHFSYQQAGLMLVVTLYAATMLAVRKKVRSDLSSAQNGTWVFFAAATISLIAFSFGTEMHERYLFPFVLFGLPWALHGKWNGVLYAMVSGLFFINLAIIEPYGILTRAMFDQIPSLSVITSGMLVMALLLLIERMLPVSSSINEVKDKTEGMLTA